MDTRCCFKSSDAQKQQYVVLGTVKDITEVTIEGDREAGAVAGALIGGVAGKNVTESETESDIASVVGGLVGSAIGSEGWIKSYTQRWH